jgi:hypothetical protein
MRAARPGTLTTMEATQPWAEGASADPRTHLMLDLKGFSRRIAVALEAHLRAAPSRSLTLCARHWPLLAPFRDSGHRVVLSAGNRARLRALVRRGGGGDGVSLHAGLLGPAVVARLRETTDLVMSWPVNTSERMSRLAACGVNAFISDEWAALGPVGREAAAA